MVREMLTPRRHRRPRPGGTRIGPGAGGQGTRWRVADCAPGRSRRLGSWSAPGPAPCPHGDRGQGQPVLSEPGGVASTNTHSTSRSAAMNSLISRSISATSSTAVKVGSASPAGAPWGPRRRRRVSGPGSGEAPPCLPQRPGLLGGPARGHAGPELGGQARASRPRPQRPERLRPTPIRRSAARPTSLAEPIWPYG